MLFTMHASVMIFLVIIPVLAGAFGNYCIPLMIGADDMAFPLLNMMSYWFMWPAIGFFMASFFVHGGGPAAGWTVYPVLADLKQAAPGSGTAQTFWLVGPDVRRRLVDDGLGQLPDDHHQHARPGHDPLPHAADDLGHVHHGHPAGLRPPRADGGRLHAACRPRIRERASSSRPA